jgi:hypothetical protein
MIHFDVNTDYYHVGRLPRFILHHLIICEVRVNAFHSEVLFAISRFFSKTDISTFSEREVSDFSLLK